MGSKTIFVVDGSLEIHETSVSEEGWTVGYFPAEIGRTMPAKVMVCKGGWNKFTSCAGFADRNSAERFKEIITKSREDKYLKDVSERLQFNRLGKCRDCLYENDQWQFEYNGHHCPVCGRGNVVYA